MTLNWNLQNKEILRKRGTYDGNENKMVGTKASLLTKNVY